MPHPRDPISVHYDGYVHVLMLQAARAAVHRKSVRVWIASPRPEFRRRDAGGRTAHERGFTRSAYYLIRNHYPREGNDRFGGDTHGPQWSLQLFWDEDDGHLRVSSRGRLARQVLVRLRPRDQVKRSQLTGPSWVDTPALRSGGGERSRF